MLTPQETQKIFKEFRMYCRRQRKPMPFVDWLYRKKKITIDELTFEEEPIHTV